MNKLFGHTIAAQSGSSAKLTKRKVASEPPGSAYSPNVSMAASRVGSSPRSSPMSLVTTTRTGSQHASTRHPYSQTEVYWAVRALRSETLLAAQTTHHNEVRGILSSAEHRRAREILELKREHDTRHFRLEVIALSLFLSLLSLVIIVFYLLASSPRQRIPERTRWGLSHHFTIPILSPFTSVVEKESGVIGARSITLFIVVSGAGIYGLFKYWLDHKSMK